MRGKNFILTILMFLFVSILGFAVENPNPLTPESVMEALNPDFVEGIKEYKPNLENIDKMFNYIEKNIKQKGRAIFYGKLDQEKKELIVTDENNKIIYIEKLPEKLVNSIPYFEAKQTYSLKNGKTLNVQKDAGEVGLMPYQYEYEKSLKVYSLTIDLEKVGKDPNFPDKEADNKEKFERVKSLLEAVENLSLVVKGNLDNAEPVFAIGGLSLRKTHYFENVVRVEQGALVLGEALKEKKEDGFSCALLKGDIFTNEVEIIKELQPISMREFFKSLIEDVKNYYGA